MGQVYSVELVLKYKDEKAVIQAAKDFIESTNADYVKNYGYDSIDSVVKTILAAHQNMFEKIDEGQYCSSFDASCGWEVLLSEFYDSIRPYLKRGSKITVWPDNGHWTKK